MCDIYSEEVQLASKKAIALGGAVIATSIAGSAVTAIVNRAADRELIPDNDMNTGVWSVLGGIIGALAWWQVSK